MNAARYEYRTVKVDGANEVQPRLDEMAAQGWRLASTYESMGYTVRLIFERPVGAGAGNAQGA